MTGSTRGFTLIELLVTLVVLSILVRIAIPQIENSKRSGRAAQVVGALSTLRTTAYAYQASTSQWPANTAVGRAPRALVAQLPTGFGFQTPEYRLQWTVTRVRSRTGVRDVPLVRAYFTDLLLCGRVAGLLGGARNRDVVAVCRGGNAYVSWSFDR
ncbi:MAG: type II secretion system protein [Gemmatimonadales bacterium]